MMQDFLLRCWPSFTSHFTERESKLIFDTPEGVKPPDPKAEKPKDATEGGTVAKEMMENGEVPKKVEEFKREAEAKTDRQKQSRDGKIADLAVTINKLIATRTGGKDENFKKDFQAKLQEILKGHGLQITMTDKETGDVVIGPFASPEKKTPAPGASPEKTVDLNELFNDLPLCKDALIKNFPNLNEAQQKTAATMFNALNPGEKKMVDTFISKQKDARIKNNPFLLLDGATASQLMRSMSSQDRANLTPIVMKMMNAASVANAGEQQKAIAEVRKKEDTEQQPKTEGERVSRDVKRAAEDLQIAAPGQKFGALLALVATALAALGTIKDWNKPAAKNAPSAAPNTPPNGPAKAPDAPAGKPQEGGANDVKKIPNLKDEQNKVARDTVNLNFEKNGIQANIKTLRDVLSEIPKSESGNTSVEMKIRQLNSEIDKLQKTIEEIDKKITANETKTGELRSEFIRRESAARNFGIKLQGTKAINGVRLSPEGDALILEFSDRVTPQQENECNRVIKEKGATLIGFAHANGNNLELQNVKPELWSGLEDKQFTDMFAQVLKNFSTEKIRPETIQQLGSEYVKELSKPPYNATGEANTGIRLEFPQNKYLYVKWDAASRQWEWRPEGINSFMKTDTRLSGPREGRRNAIIEKFNRINNEGKTI